jgi:hypothetical protein
MNKQTERCPGCGCKFHPEDKLQVLCLACEVRHDARELTQRHLSEREPTVSLGCITSGVVAIAEVTQ